MNKQTAKLFNVNDALEEIIEHLDNRADVDDGRPNAAMRLMGTAKKAQEDLKSVIDSTGEAAAPALLDVVNKLIDAVTTLSIYDEHQESRDVVRAVLSDARAAIALAKQPNIDPVTGLPFNKD